MKICVKCDNIEYKTKGERTIIMKTFYLVDFENVHNEGIVDIDKLSKEEYVHIFSTVNALNIRNDIFWINVDIKSHLVTIRKQSLDMHLVSYLGYLIGIYGKDCTYVIVSKDKDYDNVINFWKQEGYVNIFRTTSIQVKDKTQANSMLKTKAFSDMQRLQVLTNKQNEGKTSTIIPNANNEGVEETKCQLSENERNSLSLFVQHSLVNSGYSKIDTNKICKCVIIHYNDNKMLNNIHNNLRQEYDDYAKIYKDVKNIIKQFNKINGSRIESSVEESKTIQNEKLLTQKDKMSRREAQIRSFFGQHFKKKIYTDKKEKIIDILISAKTKTQVNNELLKIYSDSNVVKHIYKELKLLIKELPGK